MSGEKLKKLGMQSILTCVTAESKAGTRIVLVCVPPYEGTCSMLETLADLASRIFTNIS